MRSPNAEVPVISIRDPAWPDPRPETFIYRGGRIRVAQVLDCWTEAGRWWEQEPEAVVWRVADARGGVYELLMRRTEPPKWWLVTIWD